MLPLPLLFGQFLVTKIVWTNKIYNEQDKNYFESKLRLFPFYL